MNKKNVMGLFAVILVLSMLFTACSSNGGTNSGNSGGNENSQQQNQGGNNSPDQAEDKEEGFHIALLDGTNQNPWRTQFEDQMKKLADEYKEQGVISKYDVFVAQNDPAVQAQQMEQLINAGVDAIIINPVSASAMVPVIDKAVEKGILVLGVDQHINHPDVISVSNDQYEWAKMQAVWFVEQLGGKGKILWFDALAGAPANDIRSQAYKEVLDKNPDIEVLKHVNADWDQGKAKQLMTQMISTFPDYDGILTQDGQGVGIMNAILEAGAPLPKAITSDGVVAYLKLWKDINAKDSGEKLNVIIVPNPPGIGVDTINVAVRLLQGKELKDDVLSYDAGDPDNKNALLIKPTLTITNENLEEYYEIYKDKPETSNIDSSLTQEQVDRLFK